MAGKHTQLKPHQIVACLLGLLLVIILCVLGGLYYSKFSKAKTDVNTATENLKLFADLDYSGPSVSLFDDYVTLSDINIVPHSGIGMPTTIGSLSYQYKKDDSGKLLSMSLRVVDLKTRISEDKLNPNAAMALDLLRLKEVHTSFTFDFHFKPNSKMVMMKFSQEFIGLCKVGFGVILTDFDPHSPEFAQSMTAQIKQVHFEYTDKSLIPTLLNAIAKQESITKEQLLAGLEMRMSEVVAKTNNAKYQAMMNTFITFIKNPGTLVIDINPDPPITISDLKEIRPEDIADRLNLQVSVTN